MSIPARRSFFFFYNKPKVKFMHRSNHTEHCRKELHHLTRTEHDSTSVQYTFKWNTSVTGHKQVSFAFPQIKMSAKVKCKLRSQYLCFLQLKQKQEKVIVRAILRIFGSRRLSIMLSPAYIQANIVTESRGRSNV